jgi:hypothetical protein
MPAKQHDRRQRNERTIMVSCEGNETSIERGKNNRIRHPHELREGDRSGERPMEKTSGGIGLGRHERLAQGGNGRWWWKNLIRDLLP